MGEIMADQIIPESDSNELKTKRAAETTDAPPPIFEPEGCVMPSQPTEGATMPQADENVKRGRGRPRKTGTTAKPSGKKKTPQQTEAQGMASAHIIVSGLDLVRRAVSGGECQENPELRAATLQAWEEYLRENGWEVPAWVQVSVISIAYTAPAFATDSGKGKLSGLWAKAKGWWVARRG